MKPLELYFYILWIPTHCFGVLIEMDEANTFKGSYAMSSFHQSCAFGWQDLSDLSAGLDTEQGSVARQFARVFSFFECLQ